MDTVDTEALRDQVIAVLKDCYDPEIPVNVYDMGLIYDIDIDGDVVRITMTLTSPSCPVAETMPPDIEMRVNVIAGVSKATVEVVWEPIWNPTMMSEAAQLELNM